MKSVRLLGVLGLVLGAASPAVGQVAELYIYPDTALSVVVGDSGKARLQVTSIPSSVGVGSYDITIYLDDARVQLVRADAVAGSNLPAPTITPGSNQVTLTASGAGTATFTAELADLWFRVPIGAVEGSLLSLRVNALTSSTATDLAPTHRTGVLNACQANTFWGDLTGEHLITSRDALVALTAAVGLPTAPFDISPGEVDEDGVITSRDALLILSHSIRLYTGVQRLGKPKANRCAPLAAVPNDMAFYRSTELWKVAANDTMPAKVNLPILPYNGYRTVWSPDGQRVLFTHYVGSAPYYYYDVMSSTAPFTTVDTLTRNTTFYDVGADWSPDGRRIAFVSDRVSPPAVFKMDANGANQTQLSNSTVTASTGQPVSFHPDGRRIAFIAYATASCCNTGIWVTHADTTAILEQVLPGTPSHNPTDVSWNAAGDSIFYRNGSTAQVFVVPYVVGAGPATGVPASRLNNLQDSPGASSLGPAFRSFITYPRDFYLRRTADGRHVRILHGTTSNEAFIAFRPNSTYIQTVAISSPASPQNVAVAGSFAATAVVSDANPTATNPTVPITWISRNIGVATVSPTGPRTADVTGVANGSTYLVVTAGGWRSDSIQVIVP